MIPIPRTRGNSSRATRRDYPALGQPLSVVIYDLNNDGRPDIAVADGAAAGVLLQNSDGTFAAEMQVGF